MPGTKKWGQVIRSAAPVTHNLLSKPGDTTTTKSRAYSAVGLSYVRPASDPSFLQQWSTGANLLWSTMRKHEESDAPVPPRAFAIKNAFQNAWLVSASGQMRPWRLLSFTICHWVWVTWVVPTSAATSETQRFMVVESVLTCRFFQVRNSGQIRMNQSLWSNKNHVRHEQKVIRGYK